MLSNKQTKAMLVLAIVALFVTAFAYTAFAYSAQATPFTYTGKVVAINNANKILTVQAGKNDQHIFKLNNGASITKCSKPVEWKALKNGDKVTISYFERGNGNYVADTVALAPGMNERC